MKRFSVFVEFMKLYRYSLMLAVMTACAIHYSLLDTDCLMY